MWRTRRAASGKRDGARRRRQQRRDGDEKRASADVGVFCADGDAQRDKDNDLQTGWRTQHACGNNTCL